MNNQNNLQTSMYSIVLDRMEAYDASQLNCYPFRRCTDEIEGNSLALGNMISGYPFEIEGIKFMNSESAYIAGLFSNNSDEHNHLQQELIAESNGYMAKKQIRRFNEDKKRYDWEEFNIQWMLYVVWCKTVGNENFRNMLLDLPNEAVIIEDSTFQNGRTADIWGTKNKTQRDLSNKFKKELKIEGKSKAYIKNALDEMRLGEWRNKGVFIGKNLMGKILMLCRESVINGTIPPIDENLLKSKKVFLLGKEISFDFIPTIKQEDVIASDEIILDREEIYDPQKINVWPFKHVDDIVEGIKLDLCNMTSCYPFECQGINWRSSEELYLCGEFSNGTEEHIEIQKELISTKSPYASKRFVKGKYRKEVREDFAEFRTQWMLWVVWQKCIGNIDFRRKLISIPHNVILVEDTTTDTGGSGKIWGCSNKELTIKRKEAHKNASDKYFNLSKDNRDFLINIEVNSIRNVGIFKGQNNIGKILMICRQCLKNGTQPDIDLKLLDSKKIFIFGKRIYFLG